MITFCSPFSINGDELLCNWKNDLNSISLGDFALQIQLRIFYFVECVCTVSSVWREKKDGILSWRKQKMCTSNLISQDLPSVFPFAYSWPTGRNHKFFKKRVIIWYSDETELFRLSLSMNNIIVNAFLNVPFELHFLNRWNSSFYYAQLFL